jgi:hypothetical protein
MSPVQVILMVAGAASAAAWTASLITREHSWVDRAWSVLPVIYLWIFALAPDSDNPRLTLMAILVTAWGARLTFNFARKGGYRGVEDYRWPILRRWMSPGLFVVFNLVFIVLYQNALLVLITLPAQTVLEHPNTSLGVLDAVVAVIFLAFLAGETSADRQQWDFQQWKKLQHAAGVDARPRFVVSGLVAVFATSQLLLRTGPVVDPVFICGDRQRRMAALVRDRGRPADSSLRRLNGVHRAHHPVAVSGVCPAAGDRLTVAPAAAPLPHRPARTPGVSRDQQLRAPAMRPSRSTSR